MDSTLKKLTRVVAIYSTTELDRVVVSAVVVKRRGGEGQTNPFIRAAERQLFDESTDVTFSRNLRQGFLMMKQARIVLGKDDSIPSSCDDILCGSVPRGGHDISGYPLHLATIPRITGAMLTKEQQRERNKDAHQIQEVFGLVRTARDNAMQWASDICNKGIFSWVESPMSRKEIIKKWFDKVFDLSETIINKIESEPENQRDADLRDLRHRRFSYFQELIQRHWRISEWVQVLSSQDGGDISFFYFKKDWADLKPEQQRMVVASLFSFGYIGIRGTHCAGYSHL